VKTKVTPMTIEADPWADDSPAIAGPQIFDGDGDTYSLSVLDGALRFELDRVRIERGDLWGTMTIRTTLHGARTYNGVLSTGSINLSSVDTRHKRAKQYAELARAPQIDFLRLLESFAYRVHDAVRTGDPAVNLREIPPATPVDFVDIHGVQLLDRHPVIAFGDGGCGKSLLALWWAGEMTRRGFVVLYADWELSAEDHRDRLDRIFGADLPSVLYARCARPLTAEVDRLKRLTREHRVDYAVFDSVAFACDGRPEDAEVAVRYFQCLRQIGVGSLNIAHTNKSDESDKKPFGSSFWHNGARSTINVKLADGSHPSEITVACFNRKANLGARRPAVGFRIAFGQERTTIAPTDLAHVDELAAELPLWQRIQAAVQHQPQSLPALADQLGAKLDSVEKAVTRKSKLFTRTPNGLIALVERRSA
jgi:hypothetical protein